VVTYTLRCVYSTVLYSYRSARVLSTTRAAAVEAMALVDRYLFRPATSQSTCKILAWVVRYTVHGT
jgi:hypothetical protein